MNCPSLMLARYYGDCLKTHKKNSLKKNRRLPVFFCAAHPALQERSKELTTETRMHGEKTKRNIALIEINF